MTSENRDWQELCEAASKEPDSERLMTLIWELIDALDERKTTGVEAEGARAKSRSEASSTHNFVSTAISMQPSATE